MVDSEERFWFVAQHMKQFVQELVGMDSKQLFSNVLFHYSTTVYIQIIYEKHAIQTSGKFTQTVVGCPGLIIFK